LEEADEATKNAGDDSNNPVARWGRGSDLNAVLQLYITTKEKKYAERFLEEIWPSLERSAARGIRTALIALPYMDDGYKAKLKEFVVKYKESLAENEKNNPYGVPITLGGWGGSGGVVNFAVTNYYANKAFPEIIDKEYVFKGLDYIFGCHPYSNVSFVNGVGAKTKKVAYGINRADFTTITGGIVPGLILLKPDYLENKDDWPFLWGENEVTIGGSAEYIFLGSAVNELVKKVNN
jgi:hypothetical protein